jgi:hypothetical protein
MERARLLVAWTTTRCVARGRFTRAGINARAARAAAKRTNTAPMSNAIVAHVAAVKTCTVCSPKSSTVKSTPVDARAGTNPRGVRNG